MNKNNDIKILNKLVGEVTEDIAESMNKNLECFLHPNVSLFIPSHGYCKYAVTPGHTHPAYTFIYYFQPVMDFIVEDRHLSYELSSGKCLSAMSPGIHHQEVEEEYFQSYIAIAIDEKFFEQTALQYVGSIPVFRGEIFVPYSELLALLRCFMVEVVEHRNKEVLDNLASLITHFIVRSVISDSKREIQLYGRFEVDRVISYMNSHYSSKITIEDLAEQVNISAGHFSKVFKMVTGETPNDFLNLLRLQKSCTLLMKSENNITDIALACGFSSSSYFSTCFLKKYNMTPSAYRNKYLNINREFL